MNQKIQKEWINDNEPSHVKFLRRGQSVSGAELVACKPFSPKRIQTDQRPNRVETGGSVSLERQ